MDTPGYPGHPTPLYAAQLAGPRIGPERRGNAPPILRQYVNPQSRSWAGNDVILPVRRSELRDELNEIVHLLP